MATKTDCIEILKQIREDWILLCQSGSGDDDVDLFLERMEANVMDIESMLDITEE